MRSQACLQCTRGASATESWISGEERVSFCSEYLNSQVVNILKAAVIFDLPDVIDRAKLILAKENISESRVTLLKGDILYKAFPSARK